MERAPKDDRWRRLLIERSPPETWAAITVWALVLAAGVGLGLSEAGASTEWVALLLFLLGGLQVLRGLTAIVCLRLWGTAQPLRTFVRRRLGG